MRLADMHPGLLVALPGNAVSNYGFISGRDESVRVGKTACPARIVAVGKFRWQRQGNCEAEIVEDNYQTMVHVQIPDFKTLYTNRQTQDYAPPQRSWSTYTFADDKWPGYPRGPKVPSKAGKSFPMIDLIVNPRSVIMPWDHFLKVREERLFAQAEAEGYQARQRDVIKELMALVRIDAEMLPKEYTDGRAHMVYEYKGDQRRRGTDDLEEATEIEIDFKVRMPIEIAKLIEGVPELLAEHADLTRRLTCAR